MISPMDVIQRLESWIKAFLLVVAFKDMLGNPSKIHDISHSFENMGAN